MSFRTELTELINHHSVENRSNTPDFILANYLIDCIRAYDRAVSACTDYVENTPKVAAEQKQNPFGVEMQPPNVNPVTPSEPIPAPVGNKVTSGWSNPFGGTSWGV
jgi:hypothetical protein